MKWKIECGEHAGIIEADGPGEAWRKFMDGKTKGVASLARFRQIPLDGRWLGRKRRSWKYCTPEGMDELNP